MTDIMILAAGLGTRMKSRRAKVLHELAGRPLISHAARAAIGTGAENILVVVGHQAEEVERAVREEVEHSAPAPNLWFILQAEQRGTGHAVMSARKWLQQRTGRLIVMAGDIPMIRSDTLRRLIDTHVAERNDATILTVLMDDPTGYGRILKDNEGRFVRSVEQRDASPEQLAVREVNVSLYCFETAPLVAALDRLTTDNAQGEYYLTDVPEIMLRDGKRVGVFLHADPDEVKGVNTRVELAALEKLLRERKLRELMLSGVTILDPASTYIHPQVEIGTDTIVYPQVTIEGASRIGSGCTIRSWTRLRNVAVGDGVAIGDSCVIEETSIKDGARVGPFARLRMQADIGEGAVIGNFVEVKKSEIGRGTKAQHLSYLGDATLGANVNIGAGTVTCNYDGKRKHQTHIEDDVKIGSDTMLVAPVRVGRGSVTGAGAVVTRDVPPDSLVAGVPAQVKKTLK